MRSPLDHQLLKTVLLLFIVLKNQPSLGLDSLKSSEVSTISTTSSTTTAAGVDDSDDGDYVEGDHAPSCLTTNDCFQPVGSFCLEGFCRCKIFYTVQKNSFPKVPEGSSSSSSSSINPNQHFDSVCVPIRCSSPADCAEGQGKSDYQADLLTCVSSSCQCKTPLVLVDSDTRCGYPVWVLLFKWGGLLSLATFLLGGLICCCHWSGLLRLCTGGQNFGAGGGVPNGVSSGGGGGDGSLSSPSRVTFKSAGGIIGDGKNPPKLASASFLELQRHQFLLEQQQQKAMMMMKVEKSVHGGTVVGDGFL